MSKTIDFDAYRSEKKQEPIVIKAFGKSYELPPSPRLSIMEKLIELRQKKGDEGAIPEEEIVEMTNALLGEKQAKDLSKKGITLEELEWLLLEIWKCYNPNKEEGKGKNQSSTSSKSGD